LRNLRNATRINFVFPFTFKFGHPNKVKMTKALCTEKHSLRTADVFPVVASLPPKNNGGKEATTGNKSAVRRLARAKPWRILIVVVKKKHHWKGTAMASSVQVYTDEYQEITTYISSIHLKKIFYRQNPFNYLAASTYFGW